MKVTLFFILYNNSINYFNLWYFFYIQNYLYFVSNEDYFSKYKNNIITNIPKSNRDSEILKINHK